MFKKQVQLFLWQTLGPIAESLGLTREQPPSSQSPTTPNAKPPAPSNVAPQRSKPARPAKVRRPGPTILAPAPAPRVSIQPTPRNAALSAPLAAHAPQPPKPRPAAAPTMAKRYEEVAQLMLKAHGVRVRKWRKAMSGIAWYVTYRDGSIVRLIEAPKPKGPMSMAVFLHEIGHHAIGFDVYKPRCLEEYHAWEFALRAMREHNLNLSDQVLKRRRRSLEYAVGKAVRRGIKEIPAELEDFIPAKYRNRFEQTRRAS